MGNNIKNYRKFKFMKNVENSQSQNNELNSFVKISDVVDFDISNCKVDYSSNENSREYFIKNSISNQKFNFTNINPDKPSEVIIKDKVFINCYFDDYGVDKSLTNVKIVFKNCKFFDSCLSIMNQNYNIQFDTCDVSGLILIDINNIKFTSTNVSLGNIKWMSPEYVMEYGKGHLVSREEIQELINVGDSALYMIALDIESAIQNSYLNTLRGRKTLINKSGLYFDIEDIVELVNGRKRKNLLTKDEIKKYFEEYNLNFMCCDYVIQDDIMWVTKRQLNNPLFKNQSIVGNHE